MTGTVFRENAPPTSIVIPDADGSRVWYFTDHGVNYVDRSSLSGKLAMTNIPMPSALSSNLGVNGFENISKIGPDRYLIGSSNGYVTLDLERTASSTHQIILNKVQYGDYRNISSLAPLSGPAEFSYGQNNLVFGYSVPEYDKFTDVSYQYRLEGLYNEWSPLSPSPETTFMNLGFGDYTFSVRALVGQRPTENIASYTFRVARPWYLS